MQHWIHKNVCLTLLEDVQHLLHIYDMREFKLHYVVGRILDSFMVGHVIMMMHLFAALIFQLEQIHFETFLHLARLFLGRYFLCAQPRDLRHKYVTLYHTVVHIITVTPGGSWRSNRPHQCTASVTEGPVCSPRQTPAELP